MNDVQIFSFPAGLQEYPIRIKPIDGEPWFVAADVRKALDIQQGGRAPVAIHADERRVVSEMNGVHLKGHGLLMVSESGLYKLILRSNSPAAGPFRDWVTRVVLPAIRKDGAYIMGEERLRSGDMSEDEFLARTLVVANNKLARITTERDAAKAEVSRLEPMAAAVDCMSTR